MPLLVHNRRVQGDKKQDKCRAREPQQGLVRVRLSGRPRLGRDQVNIGAAQFSLRPDRVRLNTPAA